MYRNEHCNNKYKVYKAVLLSEKLVIEKVILSKYSVNVFK